MPESSPKKLDPSSEATESDKEGAGALRFGLDAKPNITFSGIPTSNGSLPYSFRDIVVQQTSSWQGPYPSPDAVERFEATLPGAFDRILIMAEKAQDSQIKVNENAQVFLRCDVMRSHYLGAAISLGALICSTICALTEHTTAAVALVGIPVMAVARAFLGGHKTEIEKTQNADETNSSANTPPTPG